MKTCPYLLPFPILQLISHKSIQHPEHGVSSCSRTTAKMGPQPCTPGQYAANNMSNKIQVDNEEEAPVTEQNPPTCRKVDVRVRNIAEMLRRKGQYNRIESLKQEISERRDQPKKRGRGRPKGKKHKPKRPCETLTNNGGNLARSLKGSRGQANREARGRARGRARGHGRVQRLYVKRVCEDFWVTTSNADSSQEDDNKSQWTVKSNSAQTI